MEDESDTELLTCELVVNVQSVRAYGIKIDEEQEELIWIPKSLAKETHDAKQPLLVKRWLLKKKGLL